MASLAVLTQIDELLRSEYSYLNEEDECWFLGEYTSGGGYQHGHTNNTISNLKKSADRRGRPEWKYKERAIRQVAKELADAISPESRLRVTWVPIPPSRVSSDPLYDDRLVRVLHAMPDSDKMDIRELIQQRKSMEPSHLSEDRATLDEIYSNYRLAAHHRSPRPETIVLFDDVIASGAHFKAACRILQETFADVRIVGVFYARAIHRDPSVDSVMPF